MKKNKITNKLNCVMEEKKMYLNPRLNIYDLARELATNRTYISQYFNQEIHTSFNDYINSYRIKVAEQLLRNTNLPISDIAKQSGFNTLRTMQRAFIKKNNLTLTKYREIYKTAIPQS